MIDERYIIQTFHDCMYLIMHERTTTPRAFTGWMDRLNERPTERKALWKILLFVCVPPFPLLYDKNGSSCNNNNGTSYYWDYYCVGNDYSPVPVHRTALQKTFLLLLLLLLAVEISIQGAAIRTSSSVVVFLTVTIKRVLERVS